MFTNFPIYTIPPEHYPRQLNEIPQPPKILYARGEKLDHTKHMVALVGARRHSAYGKQACERIISDLASHPVTIVSGLALGIDGVAHSAALNAGLTTIAVIGSGLNEQVVYPSSHKTLAQQILKDGGTLLSELEPDTRGAKYTFPSRNRIMAGLAEVVVAVECENKSGTRITARLATEYNKEVGAVPHNIFSETGAGTNALLREGAHIIRNGSDILDLLGLEESKQKTSLPETLTDAERHVYNALTEPKTKTALSQKTSIPTHTLSSILVALEMKGLVTENLGTVQRIR